MPYIAAGFTVIGLNLKLNGEKYYPQSVNWTSPDRRLLMFGKRLNRLGFRRMGSVLQRLPNIGIPSGRMRGHAPKLIGPIGTVVSGVATFTAAYTFGTYLRCSHKCSTLEVCEITDIDDF